MQKKLSIIFIFLMFIMCMLFCIPHNKFYKVTNVVSPCKILLEDNYFYLNDLTCFDATYSEHNKKLAYKLGITEDEAFLFGNSGKNWASKLIKYRNVYIKNNDLIYFKYSYRSKLLHSGFCIINDRPYSQESFNYRLGQIRKGKFCILDLDTEQVFEINKNNANKIKNFLVLHKSQVMYYKNIFNFKKNLPKRFHSESDNITVPALMYENKDFKLIVSDFTTTLKPHRNCNTLMCKEILSNIQKSQKTIDMAIYGYSKVPEIENALIDAKNRGVKIRLVYDQNSKGENIYPDTKLLTKIIPYNKSDIQSDCVNNIMHNKFYIFDDKILITGSANLSSTDTSGFNTNNIVVINNPVAAEIYKNEFEKMYNGKFHTAKNLTQNQEISPEIKVYFSPQDKAITNAILPVIKLAKTYIYIPIFILTDKNITEELIKANARGVDVKLIADSVSSSTKHSKIEKLRQAGIQVKVENYAGKMHSKTLLVDDKYLIIGSMNFSNSGENKNDENLIVIHSPDATKFYRQFFIYQWNKIDNRWLKYNPKSEGKSSIGSCNDGIDNNYNGLIDSDDLACK